MLLGAVLCGLLMHGSVRFRHDSEEMTAQRRQEIDERLRDIEGETVEIMDQLREIMKRQQN